MGVELEIDEGDDGMRLDVFLVRRVTGLSRLRARRMLEQGHVFLNGRRAKKGLRLRAGDRVGIDRLPPPADFVPLAVAGPLRIVYEDDVLVIVDKPAGVPTHPLRPDEQDTVANALLARYPEMERVGYALREPGILHRLDNETSGLLLAARDAWTFDVLQVALKGGAIDKRYELLVDGALEGEQTLGAPIARHPTDPRRVHVCLDPLDRRIPVARPARTELLAASAVGDRFTRVTAKALVAVRHQIRAHLAAIGHPLVGDWLYGGSSRELLHRHFLHASELRFRHPRTAEPLRVTSELPPELATFLEEAS